MSGDTLKYQPSTDNSDPIVAAMRSVLKAETVTSKCPHESACIAAIIYTCKYKQVQRKTTQWHVAAKAGARARDMSPWFIHIWKELSRVYLIQQSSIRGVCVCLKLLLPCVLCWTKKRL